MIRASAWSLVATAIRLLGSLVLFMVLARMWGPATFGAFMYPYAVAAILVKLVDYGFMTQVARDVARSPAQMNEIVERTLAAKLLLAAVIAAAAAVLAARTDATSERSLLLLLLTADAVVGSFSLFLIVPLRALGLFDREAAVTTTSSVLLFAAAVGTGAAGGGPVAVAVAFLAARVASLGVSSRAYCTAADTALRVRWSWRPVALSLVTGLPFAVHAIVGTLNMQIDAVMLQAFLGSSAVGVHQAGMRLLLGALVVADALNAVFLTSAARVLASPAELTRLGTRMMRHMVAFGVACFACFLGGAPWVVDIVFADGYAALVPLLPLFGLVALLRYGGVAYGTLLTLADRQAARAWAVAGMLGLTILLNAALIPRLGIGGALVASIAAHAALYTLYALLVYTDHRSWLMDQRTLLLCAAVAAGAGAACLPAMGGAPQRAGLGIMLILACLVLGVTGDEWHAIATRAKGWRMAEAS